MNITSLIQLFTLSAIWGASFLFMRITVPYLGTVLLIEIRVGLAAIFLLGVTLLLRKRVYFKQHWKHFLVLGLFNSALPFLLLAYAAQTLTASLLSILNATAPIWGVIIASIWTKTPLSNKTIFGLILGITGVYLLVGNNTVTLQPGALAAIIATLSAAFSYGVASTYAQSSKKVDPLANAHGSMWAATLMLLPLLPFFPALAVPEPGIILSVVALGVLCSGVAYLLYFRLIANIGAASALTVTYLIPLFGILWGVIFLNETIGWHTVLGASIVLIGTSFVTGFSIKMLVNKIVN